uniref:Uncharacterized protein LOC113795569 n=1 Tax=Dermatophagoides pteronyssinus TaxID=6956 RepID=A0A6P6Y9E0_DERPT|nr:uncharacterized protein LOC113795569 [Dermatophagoides pteronyssinus]
MDLVVNVEENVLLECNHNDDEDGSLSYQYIWCRYELTNDWSIQSNQSLLFNQIHHTTNKKVNEKIAVDNQQQKNKSNIVNHQTCFNGDRYLIVNENHISTIIYRCEIRQQQQTNSILLERKIFKLYVDQFSIVHRSNKRAVREISRKIPGSKKIQYRANCYHSAPPRCKPYATVEYAQCTRIELKIRYPTNQYGYNHSIDYWGTINCNDNDVIGYQLWLIGYGIVKKFRSNERIIMNNLIPGKRYCFNGWAYNSCGRGPVFTLEGVCAINNQDCHVKSDEHCELDVDYSW